MVILKLRLDGKEKILIISLILTILFVILMIYWQVIMVEETIGFMNASDADHLFMVIRNPFLYLLFISSSILGLSYGFIDAEKNPRRAL